MSKKLFYFIALLGAMVVFAPACGDSDPCKDVDCGVNGTCFEGVCACNDGFEGDACEIEWAAKFVGSYLGSDICAGVTYNLTKPAVVTRVTESSVRISNFGGFDSLLDANIEDGNKLTFTNYTDPASRKFTGTAQINGNTISGSYTVTYSDNTTESCTFTYTK
ncbi:MAG: hypothetical protein IPM98_05465 [Lewinellaceae bacterium]|nr:hypothetical protein [Lewinellaceae bacterium]